MTDEEVVKFRVVCLADSHNQTPALPSGDILIHAGDLTNQGTQPELQRQITWLQSKSDFKAKIVVAGNHDVRLDANLDPCNPQHSSAAVETFRNAEGITYLCHESKCLEIPLGESSVKINAFGSPYSLAWGPWGFGYKPEEAEELWSVVPQDTDILVSHGPPMFLCDTSRDGEHDGCVELLRALQRIRPKLHVFGHRHEGRGCRRVFWDGSSGDVLKSLVWKDPGEGNSKLSLADTTGKKGREFWSEEDPQLLKPKLRSLRQDHETQNPQPSTSKDAQNGDSIISTNQTCIVNAAIMAKSYTAKAAKVFNKPIVVDINLPLRRSSMTSTD